MDERPKFKVETWLSEVYAMSCDDVALDEVFDKIGDILDDLDMKHFDDGMEALGGPRLFPDCKGEKPNFKLVNEIIEKADPWKMKDAVSIAFLVMTFKNKDEYSNYWPFVKKCRKRFLETGSRKRAKALLRGYT